jgi:nicotinamidase/pyrazinamidase
VLIVGLATDYCVKETTLDAIRDGFGAAVLTEGVRAVDREPGDGERALRELSQAGAQLA